MKHGLTNVVNEIKSRKAMAHAVKCDVSNQQQVNDIITEHYRKK